MSDERIKIWPVLMFQFEKIFTEFGCLHVQDAGDVKGSEITADNDN
jgi:hypothetical protein